MPLPNLLLPPDQSGYAIPAAHTVVSTELDGGGSRFRADQLGSSFKASVQWTMNKKNYNYLMAFYRTSTGYGALPFTVGLILDSGDLQTYTAHFVPDTFGLTGQKGSTYVVAAVLEIVPNATYAAGDAALIAGGVDA